jgi:hypothetical protein
MLGFLVKVSFLFVKRLSMESCKSSYAGKQCYFSKETGFGTHTVTKIQSEGRISFSLGNCTEYASLFERRVVG